MARLVSVLLALLVAPAALAQRASDTPAPDTRAELRALEAVLTRAADAVARPSVFALQAGACRGYRIEGVGAVFVLPARILRSGSLLVLRRSNAGRARRMTPVPQGELDREIRVIELQAEALQREAARTQREVERAIAEVRSEIHRRQPEATPATAAPQAPAEPELPVAPAPPEPPLPPSPPWTLWFDAGLAEEESEPPAAAAVVARMRTALVEALSSHGAQLRALRGEETVAAAVDFVPGFPFEGARVEKTLVVRVRKKDLDERSAGKIGPEELKARVEVEEY